MIVRLFDIQNSKVVPSEHCYSLGTLKCIMDEYGDDAGKVYAYIFYMTCPDPDMNPFFNVLDYEKEELVLREVDADFSTDDDMIVNAVEFCRKLYETPTFRAYKGIASMLDRLARYMETTEIEHGRDGNINSLVNAAAKFEQIRASFKGAYSDLKEEQKSSVRGGQGLAYDQL
jgi:hypothetical protein